MLLTPSCTENRNSRRRLIVESLEQRQLLTTFTVVNSNDSGEGSLRQAVIDANQHPNDDEIDRIDFDLPADDLTINVRRGLSITDAVHIDGTSQPGFNGTPIVVLDGQNRSTGNNALTIESVAGGSTIRGLVIHQFSGSGIHIDGSDNNVIAGNYIGTDATGRTDLGNSQFGILIESGSDNLIGGVIDVDRNIVSGNGQAGIFISSPTALRNAIRGNYIGVSSTGRTALGNSGNGINVNGALQTQIGGSADGAGNVISGNGNHGIRIGDTTTQGAIVQGNRIGTDVTGRLDLGNSRTGVLVVNSAANQIGGENGGDGNQIAGNGEAGVYVEGRGSQQTKVQGNSIGLHEAGHRALANDGHGVRLISTRNVLVGGEGLAGNTISGNRRNGILVDGTSTRDINIVGNVIGLGTAGRTVPNEENGVYFLGVRDSAIGGARVGEGNTISGNRLDGIRIQGPGENVIQGNVVGLDTEADVAFGNGRNGVTLIGARGTRIGGDSVESGNTISGNTGDGIFLGAMIYGPIYTWPVEQGGNGHHYVTIRPSTWQEAENLARRHGGHLASITSAGEQEFVRDQILSGDNYTRRFWIGLTDRDEEGVWQWTSGEPFEYASWHQGEPNNLRDEDFVHINYFSGNPRLANWNDTDSYSDYAILEFPADAKDFIPGARDNAEISITNNRIGVSRSVASAISNGGHGIRVENGRSNTIGSGNAGNVVSGNLRAGISLEGLTSQTTIEGNIIGTDSSGLTDLGNGSDGIAVLGTSSENIIGKPEANSGNLIAFNAGAGIRIDSEQTASAVSTFDTSTERWTATDDVLKRGGDIRVFHGEDFGNPGGGLYTRNPSNSNTNFWRAPSKFLGNRSASYGGTITYDVQQTLVDANNLEPHIILVSGDRRLYYVTRELPRPNLWHTYEIPITASAGWTDAFPQQGNRPSEDEMREVLAHLTDLYVRAEYAHVSRADEGFMDNFAMTGVGDLVEADNTRNSIRGNSIHSNGGLGIDLGRDGPEDNDAFDSDVGPNNLLNGPILTSAVTIGKSTSVAGRLVGAASTAYTIDIYINDMCDPTGFGEGSVFVGTDVVFIDDDGQSEFNITANSAIAPGMQVVASLTDAHGNTSEFSNCVAATGRLAGDIDGNSILDVMDLDAITAAVLAGIQQSQYDVNSDGVVDNKDREHWIEDLFGTSFGDANLDGVFDSADFVLIFTAGEYEDNIDSVPSTGRNSTWAEGDWDGDGEFTTSDFVVALQTGKYVAASRSRLGDIVFATSGGNGDG